MYPRTLATLSYNEILKDCLQSAKEVRDARLGGQTMIVYYESDHDILESITVKALSKQGKEFRLKSGFIRSYPNLYTS